MLSAAHLAHRRLLPEPKWGPLEGPGRELSERWDQGRSTQEGRSARTREGSVHGLGERPTDSRHQVVPDQGWH